MDGRAVDLDANVILGVNDDGAASQDAEQHQHCGDRQTDTHPETPPALPLS
ncbi:MAG TPA: hypothetical protein VNJ47_10525 [Nevskiales bacterium]|nr:hypothetical protein [Nevskiales bacterium]